MEQQELIPHLFRSEYQKIVAVLCRLFGLEHIEIAEDITSDTFLQAAETWGLKGLPENPVAWLYTVAKNKTKDYLRRHQVFTQKIARQLSAGTATQTAEIEPDLSAEHIADSQLQMMFAICHPAIPAESQIGLALRVLCGFGIEEIAAAFLTNKETINKRLFRAKEKLRSENIQIALPGPQAIVGRLETVATTLYLLFNEGYYSAGEDHSLRKELCLEAMRLTYQLATHEATAFPFIDALLALMCFHASRFDARTGMHGEMILYEAQDERKWDQELILKGEYYLNKGSRGNGLSRYHLEAGIAYWHTVREETSGKWEQILQLYNHLLLLEYSPIAALNRTYALSRVKGREAAITEAEKLQLNGNHLYHMLLGELYTGLDAVKAMSHLQQALRLARSAGDRELIRRKIDVLAES